MMITYYYCTGVVMLQSPILTSSHRPQSQSPRPSKLNLSTQA